VDLKGKNLVLGISGGIAAYKAADLVSRLRKKGLVIDVVMTRAATEFITELTMREISGNPVHCNMFVAAADWNVEHVALAKKADLIAVIPATANIIAKIANGLADDLLTTTILAASCPKLIAPAMNTGMYDNPSFQKNLETLKTSGYQIIGPDCGPLLCGDEGPGRLADLTELQFTIEKMLTKPDFSAEILLVTAGGTREPLDPVRFIGNRSSGRMGHALAIAAAQRGAEVLLVTAADPPPAYEGMQIFPVTTAAEMRQKVLELAPRTSMVIKAAAPADYRPVKTCEAKMKKSDSSLVIELFPNPDILMELGQNKKAGQILIGFAAETEALHDNAIKKLKRKNLDLIIGNLVNLTGMGIGSISNKVTIYSASETLDLPEQLKTELAHTILDAVALYRRNGRLQ
jgi:phosphopantothenoylcysteine decarboxylase / phosphopantothenate---cysteine ligase